MTKIKFSPEDRRALLIIATVFLVACAYPFLRADPRLDGNLGQIRKMLDYGFGYRRGALLVPQFNCGRLAHPEAFNYAHHPYTSAWMYGIVYQLSGGRGVTSFGVLIGLAGCLVVYLALRHAFDPPPALTGALLYACAPALLLTAPGAGSIVISALFWPTAALLALPPLGGGPWSAKRTWLLGLICLLGVLVSETVLGTVPALLLMTAERGPSFHARFHQNLRNPRCWAILMGAGLGLGILIAQMTAYSPSLHEPVGYIATLAKPGAVGFAQTRGRMLVALVIRLVVLVGPALVLGLVVGGLVLWRTRTMTRLVAGMILYVALWLAGALALTYLFNREKWVYVWLLFPAAALTAHGLQWSGHRMLRGLLLVLIIPGLAYAQLTASLPQKSSAAEALAAFLRQQTQPEDLILTNLKPRAFPFPYWDYNGADGVANLADRLCWGEVTSLDLLDAKRQCVAGQVARVLFLLDPQGAISPDLAAKLRQEGQMLQRADIDLPPEADSFGLRLRSWYGKLQGKGAGAAQPGSRKFSGELYLLNPQ